MGGFILIPMINRFRFKLLIGPAYPASEVGSTLRCFATYLDRISLVNIN